MEGFANGSPMAVFYFSDNRHGRVLACRQLWAAMLLNCVVFTKAVSPEGELLAAMSLPREDTTVWDIAHQQQLSHYPSYGNPTLLPMVVFYVWLHATKWLSSTQRIGQKPTDGPPI